MHNIQQITIVGTGLLGASCGLGLRAAGYSGRIVGIGRRLETVERARELGCVDEAATDLGVAVQASQLVVLATPLGTFTQLLVTLARFDHGDLVMTDVGSTKQQVCADAQRLLPVPARFVGSHPMAGGEQHGPDAAKADLLQGKPCVITAGPDTDPHALRTVETLWSTLGMRLVHMPADQHDKKVACISHLPHALSSLLLKIAVDQGGLDLASTGFRDTTRVASGDPQVWRDIFATNRQAVLETIDAFIQETSEFRKVLADGDDYRLFEILRHAKQVRDDWIKRL